jgi:hypothetical protein
MDSCPICYEKDASETVDCNHKFCSTCLDIWTKINSTCPLCRTPIVRADYTQLLILLCLYLNLSVNVTFLIRDPTNSLILSTVSCICMIIVEAIEFRKYRHFVSSIGVFQIYFMAFALTLGPHVYVIGSTRVFLVSLGLDSILSRLNY